MIGRIRSIKPEALTDEKLWDLEMEAGLPLFRAFVGLWTQADREGRFEWRPRPLKAAILPYWSGDFGDCLLALERAGFLLRYEVGGKVYGLVRTFLDHQQINGREHPSRLPAPPPPSSEDDDGRDVARDASGTRAAHVEHVTPGEQNRTERNRAEQRVDDASKVHSLARGEVVDGQPLGDYLREGVIRGYGDLKKPAPKETRSMTWPGWRELEAWVVEKARLTGKADQRETGRHLIRCFLRSPVAAKKGHPIAFLVSNANEYWRDDLPPALEAAS